MANAIMLLEAKELSKIENILTRTEALYQAMALSAKDQSGNAPQEVQRYREDLVNMIVKHKNKFFMRIVLR
jgi:hypothetical protein